MSTALPTIASELHSASGYTWVGSAYLLANAAAAPIWAKLSDIWGRKIILLTSVAWFFVSSIICATAPSMSVLIAGRALQGVGGGAFVGPPQDGYVEIAYFTLENEQRKGYAFQTASSLVAVARAHDPNIGLKAFTLKEENASTKILRALGFSIVGVAQDADAGEVWEWRA